MDLFLHIGPHKTGTTAIQTACAKNASALRRAGLLYPKCNWTYPAQHRLAFAMKGKVNPADGSKPDFEIELKELCRALTKSRLPRAFISSEEFFTCPPQRIETLKKALPVSSITILAYPRSPDDFLISCHNQKTKQVGNGYSQPIKRFLTAPREIAPEIDYLTCVSAWADAFGDDSICLQAYEAGSPFDHICELLGITGRIENATLNQSVPGVVAEAMRLAKVQNMPNDKQRKLFKKASSIFADHPKFRIANADRLRIIRAFEADNDALFTRFGLDNPFRTDRFTPRDNDMAQNVSVHDLMRLITELL